MHIYLKKFETLTHKVIPYLLIILGIIIILDNPLWTIYSLHDYETAFIIFDSIVIFFFVSDLLFKWEKVRNAKIFIRLYWIDIIAVFPFYLAFRIYGEVAGLLKFADGFESAQKLAHESLLLKEANSLEELKVLSETRSFSEFTKLIQRSLRMIKARFYLTHKVMNKEKR